MQQLTSSIAKTSKMEKGIALVLLAAVVWGLIKAFNKWVAPELITFIHNMWIIIPSLTLLVFLALYIISNPLVIWGIFTTISSKITRFFVKLDPLSGMDRYVEHMKKKLNNLMGTITVVVGKKVKLDRKLEELHSKVEANLKHGAAAKKIGKMEEASTYGVKVQTDNSTITILRARKGRVDKSLEFLKNLSENWKYGIEKLEYQISAKREEYEILKEVVKGLKSAEDFISSDNEAAKLYGMSVKALEETVTQQIGYMDEFERKSKGMLSAIEIEKQVAKDEGLIELEKYMQNGKLIMPDYSQFEVISSTIHENGENKKFNLLKNK